VGPKTGLDTGEKRKNIPWVSQSVLDTAYRDADMKAYLKAFIIIII
jgi:hypothetical protein